MQSRDPLSRLSTPRFWAARERTATRSLRRSLLANRTRDRAAEFSTRTAIAFSLGRQSLPAFVTALGLLAVLHVGSVILSGVPVSAIAWAGTEVGDDTYRDLVAAGIGAIAALLGLYYATVGVVASTVYQTAPAPIRTLFVQEPSGVVYVRGVVRALVFGIALLTVAAVGTPPTPLTLGAFALLSATAVLRLMILGGRIFNFFDPTALATTLSRRFGKAVTSATSVAAVRARGVQRAAHQAARQALDTYEQLAILLEDRKGRSSEGPRRVSDQLLRAAAGYSVRKNRIPTQSEWWDTLPNHQNWMTAGALELEAARLASTGMAPKPAPNRLWVEQAVACILGRTLRDAFRAGGSPSVLTFADRITWLTANMGVRLQVDEALVIEQTWVDIVGDISVTPVGADQPAATDLNRLAAAEQIVMPLINLWLGFVQGASAVSTIDLVGLVERGAKRTEVIYQADIPPETLELVERFVLRSRDELAAEGRTITEGWWFGHYLARSISRHLCAGYDSIREAVERVADDIDVYTEKKHFDTAATIAIASLELHHKIEVHHQRLESAFDVLGQRRQPNTDDKRWSVPPDDAAWAGELRERAWRQLAALLPQLRRSSHDPSQPDLHGQTYQILFNAAFECILSGSNEVGRILFAAILNEVDVLRARLGVDLADHDSMIRFGYTLEPIVGVMELSGYARLMQEVNQDGIWDSVRDAWDQILNANGGVAQMLLAAENGVSSILVPNPGRLARTARSQQLNHLLRERGIRQSRGSFIRDRDAGPAQNPIIEAFGGSDMPRFAELGDLFIADYLLSHLPKDAELPVRARALANALNPKRGTRRRGRPPRASPTPADDGEADDDA